MFLMPKMHSAKAIRIANDHSEYLILQCPTDGPEKCVNCRSNEFGSWVQIDPFVGNPFVGTARVFMRYGLPTVLSRSRLTDRVNSCFPAAVCTGFARRLAGDYAETG